MNITDRTSGALFQIKYNEEVNGKEYIINLLLRI